MNPLELNVCLVHLIVLHIYMHILSLDMIATIYYLFIYLFIFAFSKYTPST
jgi:hypothetical protein